MNKKKDFTADFDEIKAMTNKIRSMNSLKESINFDDEYQDDGFGQEEVPYQSEGEQDLDKSAEEQELENEVADPESAVNQIREIALKGMVALCKTPEDPQYEVLKQIFNYCDKANKKKAEEANT